MVRKNLARRRVAPEGQPVATEHCSLQNTGSDVNGSSTVGMGGKLPKAFLSFLRACCNMSRQQAWVKAHFPLVVTSDMMRVQESSKSLSCITL